MAAELAPVVITGADRGPGVTAARRSGADRAVTEMYAAQYRTLVRLAALLTADTSSAEAIVQDSFVAMHRSWARFRDQDDALDYLRRSVVTRSRSAARPDGSAPGAQLREAEPARPGSAGPAAGGQPGPLWPAIRALPPMQREGVVLRFYLGLPDRQAAAAMGVSPEVVRTQLARAIAALKSLP
ncbi:MAG TPA: sigma factor-like helix-turn-helix DNA-binding protein [Streptosporangiaceae bacterium]|jgi:DNA-directed RNA polymerase specialized sigma24 family protein